MKKASTTIVEAFRQLGKSSKPSRDTVTALEEFVCQLYSPGTKMKEVGKLRWHLFKKAQAEAERLPPTAAVLELHILRAHYQAMVWYHDNEPHPNLPSPTEYGWSLENNKYVPVVTSLKPAPEAVIELVRCGCRKTQCINARCSCRKANMVCTEMCACETFDEICQNKDARTEVDVSSDEEDIEDFDDF